MGLGAETMGRSSGVGDLDALGGVNMVEWVASKPATCVVYLYLDRLRRMKGRVAC